MSEAFFQVVSHSCPRDFQTLQGIAVAHGCLPEAKVKSLVLKKPHTNPRGLEMELILQCPLWGLALMVSEDNMQLSKRGSQPTVLPSYNMYEPQQ